jgi:hypothetical protein
MRKPLTFESLAKHLESADAIDGSVPVMFIGTHSDMKGNSMDKITQSGLYALIESQFRTHVLPLDTRETLGSKAGIIDAFYDSVIANKGRPSTVRPSLTQRGRCEVIDMDL